jgi:hypothetical protein
MKALNYIAAFLLLSSCQKEIVLPETNFTKIIDEQPKEVVYREDPSELVLMRDFAPMLWDKKEYKITEYYSVKEDLWNELPNWIKDDVYTFEQYGKGWVAADLVQNPAICFETIQKKWELYSEGEILKLDWLNEHYEPATYSVVTYKSEESFTLSSTVNDSKVFFTYTLTAKK